MTQKKKAKILGTSSAKKSPSNNHVNQSVKVQASREARTIADSSRSGKPIRSQASREARGQMVYHGRLRTQGSFRGPTCIQASREARMQRGSDNPKPAHKTNIYLCQLRIAVSNDIESNPGPEDHACQHCNIDVNWSSLALQCDGCDKWSHKECLNMSSAHYTCLENESSVWLCSRCGMRNFNSSLFNNSHSTHSISMGSLMSPGEPLYCSSPKTPENVNKNKSHLRILNVNCQSISAKKLEFLHLLESTNPDVIIGTEVVAP